LVLFFIIDRLASRQLFGGVSCWDWGVSLAFLLTLGSAALCAVYGFINWNEPSPDKEIAEIAEEEAWEQKESK